MCLAELLTSRARLKRGHTGDDGGHPFTVGRLYAYAITHVCKNFFITHGHKHKLAKVGMCSKVFKGMKLRLVKFLAFN